MDIAKQRKIRRGGMSFRLWHLFVFITIGGGVAYWFAIVGTKVAVFEINCVKIDHDEQWGKYWATFDCEIHSPVHLAGENFHCFIEVSDDFSFGDYQPGDILRFRYQEIDSYFKDAQDPKLAVMKEFFDLIVLPGKTDDEYFVVGIDRFKSEETK